MRGLDKALAGVVAWIEDKLLVDTVRVALPGSGEPVFDPDTGELTYPDGDVLYEGDGAVLARSSQGDLVAVPDAQLPWTTETKSRYRLLTPLDAPVFPKDVIVTVTAVHNPANQALIGRSWVTTDPSQAATVEAVRITPLDQNRERGAL